jgi:hypothetical protein
VLTGPQRHIDDAEDLPKRAISSCEEILKKTPRFYEAAYRCALACLASGNTDEGIAMYLRAMQVCATKGVLRGALSELSLLAHAAPQTGGVQEAQQTLGSALKADPG